MRREETINSKLADRKLAIVESKKLVAIVEVVATDVWRMRYGAGGIRGARSCGDLHQLAEILK